MAAPSPLPRACYLTVHDALRRVFGAEAQISAFISQRHPFQCDMLVNARPTDPDVLRSSSGAGLALAHAIQASMPPTCAVIAHAQHMAIRFTEQHTLCLGLGPDLRDVPGVHENPADINKESDWRRRPRLRIAQGYNEELFIRACAFELQKQAALLDDVARRAVQRRSYLALPPVAECYEANGCDVEAVSVPYVYWLVHMYLSQRALHPEGEVRYEALAGMVKSSYKRYFGVYPLENPFCPGEDLNTMSVAKWYCECMW